MKAAPRRDTPLVYHATNVPPEHAATRRLLNAPCQGTAVLLRLPPGGAAWNPEGGVVSGARWRARRSIASAVVASLVTSLVWVTVPEVARAATPEETGVADGLTQMLDTLKGLDGLDELADALPFSDILPTGPNGLGVPAILDRLKNEV